LVAATFDLAHFDEDELRRTLEPLLARLHAQEAMAAKDRLEIEALAKRMLHRPGPSRNDRG
jgi:hypothetical protein